MKTRENWQRVWRRLAQCARLMVGVPDYETYVARRRHFNPEAPVMSREAFIRHCGERRFGRGSPPKCC